MNSDRRPKVNPLAGGLRIPFNRSPCSLRYIRQAPMATPYIVRSSATFLYAARFSAGDIWTVQKEMAFQACVRGHCARGSSGGGAAQETTTTAGRASTGPWVPLVPSEAVRKTPNRACYARKKSPQEARTQACLHQPPSTASKRPKTPGRRDGTPQRPSKPAQRLSAPSRTAWLETALFTAMAVNSHSQ